jgi:hypothetical protein
LILSEAIPETRADRQINESSSVRMTLHLMVALVD